MDSRSLAMDESPAVIVEHQPTDTTDLPHHTHDDGLLFFVERGLLSVKTGTGWWILPPGRLGWVPPRWSHAGRELGPLYGFAVFLPASVAERLPSLPRIMVPTPIITAILERLRSALADGLDAGRRERLVAVLIDELVDAPDESLYVAMPSDHRLVRIARMLIEDPSDPRDLDDWALLAGVSRRTLTRKIVAETGLSFGQWRASVRMMTAVRLLCAGESVTAAALTLGFDSVSSFIAAFRKHFATTPRRYIEGRNSTARSDHDGTTLSDG